MPRSMEDFARMEDLGRPAWLPQYTLLEAQNCASAVMVANMSELDNILAISLHPERIQCARELSTAACKALRADMLCAIYGGVA